MVGIAQPLNTMPQVKISGFSEQLVPIQAQLMKAIEDCFAEVTGLTADKIVQRCYPLAAADFHCPGKSPHYTIIEISVFAGRSVEIKKQLMKAIFTKIQQEVGAVATDIEIILTEIPSHQWGLRGITGDEL
jgi:phenylpyruvate tautomerase PptA (4-oxalocrotonate tautomerase family)